MDRRRLLLTALNNGVFLPYSFEHLYYSLIPETIDSKTVKNKGKLGTIYANGVIENQLVNSTDTTITIGTHKYLTYIDGTWSIITGTSQTLSVNGGTDMLIDLTLMFGTGNEPTTLTDNRIQALLNRGYIAYNTGTYKSTDIGELVAEPFNLWDEQWEVGDISDSTGVFTSGTSRLCSKNYISVIAGKTYSTKFVNSVGNFNKIYYYDSNKSFLSLENINTGVTQFTIPNDARYIKFKLTTAYGTTYNNDICINVSSSLNGTYKPYTQPQTLSFKYQGNGAISAHDTFEVTSSGYVFTKNIGSYTFTGSETWEEHSNGRFMYKGLMSVIKIPTTATEVANLLNDANLSLSYQGYSSTGEKIIWVYSGNGVLGIRDTTNITSVATAQSYMTGKTIYYELATPQTITIPKKHLAWVDLGTLNWTYESGATRFYAYVGSNFNGSANNELTNMYCEKYLTDVQAHSNNTSYNNIIMGLTSGYIYVRDSAYSSAADFKTAMSGIYLFYETEDEVTDFTNLIGVESGGTLTSDSSVLPNVDFKIKCK